MKAILTLTLITLLFGIIACEKEEEKLPSSSYLDCPDFPTEGLVAYYPFNGEALDKSSNGLDGTESNVSYISRKSNQRDKFCVFNGETSLIQVANSSLLNGKEYTICFWYRSNVNDTSMQAILSKADSEGHGYTFDLYNDGSISNPGFYYKNQATEHFGWDLLGANFREGITGDQRPFEFVAVAFSDTFHADYVRGSERTRTPSVFFNNNNFDLIIGSGKMEEYHPYMGDLDDLVIYNRILPREDVQVIYDWFAERQ